jgi:hypothetical protein
MVVRTAAELSTAFPHVAAWTIGADESNLLARNARYCPPEDLVAPEGLLKLIDDTSPTRVASKRRDFRAARSREEVQGMWSELSVAAWLIRRGFVLEFGEPGVANPDLIIPALGVGVEVTHRHRSGEWQLRQLVMELRNERRRAGRRRDKLFAISMTAVPLHIRAGVLKDVKGALAEAMDEGTTMHAVLRPSGAGYAAITAEFRFADEESFGAFPRITYTTDAQTAAGLALHDVEALLVEAMHDKRKVAQARSMPTILLVVLDGLSRTIWGRPDRVWGSRLAELHEPDLPYAAAGLAIQQSGWGEESFARLAFGISPQVSRPVTNALKAFATQAGLPIRGADA